MHFEIQRTENDGLLPGSGDSTELSLPREGGRLLRRLSKSCMQHCSSTLYAPGALDSWTLRLVLAVEHPPHCRLQMSSATQIMQCMWGSLVLQPWPALVAGCSGESQYPTAAPMGTAEHSSTTDRRVHGVSQCSLTPANAGEVFTGRSKPKRQYDPTPQALEGFT